MRRFPGPGKAFLILATVGFFCFIVASLVAAALSRWEELKDCERQVAYYRGHPEPLWLARLAAPVIVQASAAEAVEAFRVGALAETSDASALRMAGYPVVRPLPAKGMKWGRSLLVQAALWGAVPREDIEAFHPEFAVRFASRTDSSVFLLLDTSSCPDSAAKLRTVWWAKGHRRQVTAHFPCPCTGDPSADSVLSEPERFRPPSPTY